jgi:hypothetical protein
MAGRSQGHDGNSDVLANRRSGWPLVPPRPSCDHTDETFGPFCGDRPSVARRSESEEGVRVGGGTCTISYYRSLALELVTNGTYASWSRVAVGRRRGRGIMT